MFTMFLHTQELKPSLSEKICFFFSFFFSEIINLVIFKVQPGLLTGLKNVGLGIVAMHGQHSLVLL